ncbi:hypothetical protein ABZ800_14510 [Streptomyces sp. NPDC047813]|uniref:hypothetical protein n=1 Tax=Streptomyces sp. NPDC047813 TaxID=3154608 RepID=UPI0033DD8371
MGPLLDLEHPLPTSPQFRQPRDNLCAPQGGDPRVDRLVIVDASGTHQWNSPRQLGAGYGSGTASASPQLSSSGKPTCLTQTFPPGAVESRSWKPYRLRGATATVR